MRKLAAFVLTLALGLITVQADPLPKYPYQVLPDPAAHLTYYIEADRLHVCAYDATGKQVWRTTVLSTDADSPEHNNRTHINSITLEAKDPGEYFTVLFTSDGANSFGTLQKTTGLLRNAWDSQ